MKRMGCWEALMLEGRWIRELMTREQKMGLGYGKGVNGIAVRMLVELVG
jgi:hypothetical protein